MLCYPFSDIVCSDLLHAVLLTIYSHTHTHTHLSSLMRQGLLCSLSAQLRLPDPSDPSAFLSEVIGSPCKYYTTMTGSMSHSVPFPQCPWPLPINRRWAGVIVQIRWPFTFPKLALPGNHPRTFLRPILECVTRRHDLSVYLPSLRAISAFFFFTICVCILLPLAVPAANTT